MLQPDLWESHAFPVEPLLCPTSKAQAWLAHSKKSCIFTFSYTP